MPPPLPVTLATPTTSGITKADVNTGPINPTDCAIPSGNDSTLAPRRPVSGWGFAMTSTMSFLPLCGCRALLPGVGRRGRRYYSFEATKDRTGHVHLLQAGWWPVKRPLEPGTDRRQEKIEY